MLIIKSIELKNFRAVKEGIFEPLEIGITGLSGRNGVGKSAFLDGMLWALYGALPDDASQGELKNDLADTSDACYVEVIFALGDDTIKVLRELRGKNSSPMLTTWRNDEIATERSIGVGEKWIVEALGLDVESFTTAVLVRQNHLNDLVSSRPATRRALIERLANIDRLTDALKSARKDASTSKAVSAASLGSEEDVKAAKDEYAGFKAAQIEQTSLLNSESEAYEGAQLRRDAAKAEYEEKQAAARQVREAREGVVEATNAVKVAVARRDGAKSVVESTMGRMPDGSADIADLFAESKQEEDSLEATRLAIESELAIIRDNGSTAASDAAVLESRITSAKSSIESVVNRITQAQAVEPVPDADIAQAQETLDAATAKSLENAVDIRTQEGNLKTLKVNEKAVLSAQASTCPTCKTELDNPEVLVGIVQESIAATEAKISELKGLTSDLDAATSKSSARLAELKEGSRRHLDSQRQVDSLTQELEELRTNLESSETSLEGMQATIAGLRGEYTAKNQQLEESRKKWLQAQERSVQLAGALRVIEDLNRAKADLAKAQEGVDSANEAAVAAQEFVDSIVDNAPTEEEVAALAQRFNELEEFSTAALQRKNEANSNARLAEHSLASAKAKYDAAVNLLNHKKALLGETTHKVAAATIIDEFRKAQLARIAPELSEVATNLISQMTSGFYVEVTLDENFTPTLIRNDGMARPLSWLSGGERSVVALALRIAISDLISNHQGGILMLDEVLVAQDAERRQALVDTLRSLPSRQIVMINHTQGASDIVDRSITLTRGDDGSTTVIQDEDGLNLVH